MAAVLKDIPGNSHMKFQALISMATYQSTEMTYGDMDSWDDPIFFTYIQLEKNTDPKTLESGIALLPSIPDTDLSQGQHSKYRLEKIKNIHLNNKKVLYYSYRIVETCPKNGFLILNY